MRIESTHAFVCTCTLYSSVAESAACSDAGPSLGAVSAPSSGAHAGTTGTVVVGAVVVGREVVGGVVVGAGAAVLFAGVCTEGESPDPPNTAKPPVTSNATTQAAIPLIHAVRRRALRRA